MAKSRPVPGSNAPKSMKPAKPIKAKPKPMKVKKSTKGY